MVILWASYLTFPRFFIYEMGIIIAPLTVIFKIKWNNTHDSEQYFTYIK